MTDKTPEELITETHDKVTKLYAIMLGEPGTDTKGLCGEVTSLRADMNHFKRNFWILVGTLCGSGVLGVGIFQVFGG